LIENVKADKTNKNNDAGADKKTTTVIVSNSMVKYLNANRLKRSMPTGNHNIHVETYRGSTTEAIAHHIRLCLVKQPDQIVLHVGTYDIRDKQREEIVDGIMKIQRLSRRKAQKQP
jgi:hypothetical protein